MAKPAGNFTLSEFSFYDLTCNSFSTSLVSSVTTKKESVCFDFNWKTKQNKRHCELICNRNMRKISIYMTAGRDGGWT